MLLVTRRPLCALVAAWTVTTFARSVIPATARVIAREVHATGSAHSSGQAALDALRMADGERPAVSKSGHDLRPLTKEEIEAEAASLDAHARRVCLEQGTGT